MAGSKAINVKIATPKIIKALEGALAKLELDYTSQEANEAKYEQELELWKKEIAKWSFNHFANAENIRTNYRSYNRTLNVDFDITVKENGFPAEPTRNYETLQRHTYREQKEEISNAIRILKMTDEEVVSTSTYNAVARYL